MEMTSKKIISQTKHHQKLVASREILEESLVSSGGEGVLLTESRRNLLNQQPLQLLQKLREGTVTAVAVLEAFQAKAIEASKATNCITDFILEAKTWAENLDSERRAGKVKDLPLFGFPLSVKDNIMIEGHASTLGLEKRAGIVSNCDADVITIFKSMGVIPFVRTNVPQLCLSIGCSNPLFGMTVNPCDLERTPGGSSGGEGSLIGYGGSFLGLGTDVGGSARIPAHFCGIASLKPTARRMVNRGIVSPFPGAVGVFGTISFMGATADIVVDATKSFFSSDLNDSDSQTPPIPWREDLFQRPIEKPIGSKNKSLRIGWYDNDGFFEPTPGVKRSMALAVEALKELGHELVHFPNLYDREVYKLFFDFMTADHGGYCKSLMEGEELDNATVFYNTLVRVTPQVKEIAKPYVTNLLGEFASDLSTDIETPFDLWKALARRLRYVETYTSRWREEGLDAVVCPVMPMPAPKKDFHPSVHCCTSYTYIYNILDFPASIVPVTRETDEDQKLLEKYDAKDWLHELIKENTKGSTGMPLGVQFVALPFKEEILCRIMTEFSKVVNFKYQNK